MMSWLLPRNKSASLTLPVGPSKTYSFSILTQGSLRRCRFKWSRSFENFFSFARSFLRAASQSFCETTLRFSVPRTVLIFGITLDFFFPFYWFVQIFAICKRFRLHPFYKDDERPRRRRTRLAIFFKIAAV